MSKIHAWECEKCGGLFGSRDEADGCESSHYCPGNGMDYVSAKYLMQNKFPETIMYYNIVTDTTYTYQRKGKL